MEWKMQVEAEETTEERMERLREELEMRRKLRATAKGCCLWIGGAASALAIVAGHFGLEEASTMHALALLGLASGMIL